MQSVKFFGFFPLKLSVGNRGIDLKKTFSKPIYKVGAGILAIIVLFEIVECFRGRYKPAPEPEIIRPVRTVQLRGAGRDPIRRYFGSVQGSQRVNLSFRVSGPLIELPADKGTAVKTGDLLAKIDPRDFKTKLDQAQGVLAQARATYNDAEANYKRYEELYKQKVIAAAAFDDYRTQLNVAKSAVQQAESQVTAASDALRDTELLAPFDGVIVDRMVENFQDVQAKQEIINLQNIKTLEIVFNVPDKDVLMAPSKKNGELEEDISDVASKFMMYAVFDAIPGRTFPVAIKEFAAQADPQTRMYAVTVTMDQPSGARVLPGMAVTVAVDFSGGSEKGTFAVPESSILALENGDLYVWRFDEEEGTVSRVLIDVLSRRRDGLLEIHSDELSGGDIVITAGVHFLKDGQKVRLQKAGEM